MTAGEDSTHDHGDSEIDPHLSFTVATVWREERISCPHQHVLQSWLQGGLEGGAAEFVQFHLGESQCPYCNAIVDDLRTRDDEAKAPALEDLRDRLLRSTATEIRRTRA
ncbi:MAG: hypothetical protein KDC98_12560 [Planctomycetes bacterium]|nr:hypothetical protein [Planctomycetota bacterium]